MLVGILKKLVGIMIGPVGILKNACRYFETVGIMNVGIMNVGIMNATRIVYGKCFSQYNKGLWSV